MSRWGLWRWDVVVWKGLTKAGFSCVDVNSWGLRRGIEQFFKATLDLFGCAGGQSSGDWMESVEFWAKGKVVCQFWVVVGLFRGPELLETDAVHQFWAGRKFVCQF